MKLHKSNIIIVAIVLVVFILIAIFNMYSKKESITPTITSPQLTDNEVVDQTSYDKYSLEEIANYNTEENCYLAINNKVYDVSSFLNEHPGGKNRILEQCGKEVSSIFTRIHPVSAWELLDAYQIGVLE